LRVSECELVKLDDAFAEMPSEIEDCSGPGDFYFHLTDFARDLARECVFYLQFLSAIRRGFRQRV
jgi:hypothetical protein